MQSVTRHPHWATDRQGGWAAERLASRLGLLAIFVSSHGPEVLSRVTVGDERSELALDGTEDRGPPSLAKVVVRWPIQPGEILKNCPIEPGD
jgi:hypothetical protein